MSEKVTQLTDVDGGVISSEEIISQISSRDYFSVLYLQTAAMFVGNVELLEQGRELEHYSEYRSYVVGTILACVAFLEAAINEVFCDAGEHSGGVIASLAPEQRKMLADLWAANVKYTLINKYQIALAVLGKGVPKGWCGMSPCQDVQKLIKLRNALAHYEPVTNIHGTESVHGKKTDHPMCKELSGKFDPNPFVGSAQPFWPDKCLGHGCAKWALSSCLRFTDEFFAKVGVRAPYEGVQGIVESRIA